MTQYSSPRRRALIVEDEALIAFDLEATMSALGFDVCDLAPSGERARSLAMSDQPDIVLMDVCLDGCREGIEVARCFARYATCRLCSSPPTVMRIPSSASMNRCQERQCCQNRSTLSALPMRQALN